MALVASSVPTSDPVDAKSLSFHKNDGEVWNSYKDSGSSPGGHNAEDGLQNLASMMTTALDHQQKQDGSEKQRYPSTMGHGLSRNASFDSVTSHDSCTASFSTGSPVTVLPPLPPYTSSCSASGIDIISASTAGWNVISNTKRSSVCSALENPEEIFNTFNFQEHMLMSEDCEQLLASPVGALSSVLEFPDPFSRFSVDQASNCDDSFSPVSELDCLLPPAAAGAVNIPRTGDSSSVQVKSPHKSVGNNSSPSLQQQQDLCQEFLVGSNYPEHNNSRRSESSLLSPPSARRRLSWSEYQVVEPMGGLSSSAALDPLRFSCLNSQLQGSYDQNSFQLPLPSVQPSMLGNSIGGVFRSSSSVQDSLLDTLVGDAVRGNNSSLKRPYSIMMMQPSSCSITSSPPPAPSFSTSASNKYLNFAAHLPVPPVPKSLSENCSIASPLNNLPPITNLSNLSCVDTQQQANLAAFNAMLYKTQGNSTSEMLQQLQQQTQGTTSSCDSGAARPAAADPPPKLRRRHGTATDPQSIAARTRRERFSDRIRILQSLVPNGERLDTVSMLGHTLEYVRFLQHQVWTLYNGNDDVAATADSESREKWKEFLEASQSSVVA
ncbi:hypothetical protein R1flu_018761 [Riccia fluitans]|uniref:BHLH domain-containing protein n=1 Tax=Riccia fluitans TaxID=41844 RepID=A0ABD1ZGS0_9MARC